MERYVRLAFGDWPAENARRGKDKRPSTIERGSKITESHVNKVIVALSVVFVVGAVILAANTAAGTAPLPVGWDYQAPTAVFGVIALVALLNVVFPSSTLTVQRKSAPTTLAISLMGLTSYALRAARLTGPRLIASSGLVMLPIRYLEWSCTTPLLVLLSAIMVDAPVGVTARVIVYDFLTILTGAIALLLPFEGRVVVTVIACFVSVAWVVGYGRLLTASFHRARDAESRERVRFIGIVSLVLAVAYPVVYVLHAEKFITLLAQEYTYAAMDVTAKVLLTVVLTNGSFISSEGFIRQQMRRAAEELVFLNTVVRTIRHPTDAARAAISDVETLVEQLKARAEDAESAASSTAAAATPGGVAARQEGDSSNPASVFGSRRGSSLAASHIDSDSVLATLYSSVGQIKKAIMDAVFFVALQAGVVRSKPAGVSLERALADCVKGVQPARLRRGIDIITTVSDSAPSAVEADPGQLEYVLSLVCTNAVLSAPRGSKVAIEVASAPAEVLATGVPSARIVISDIGQRMNTEDFAVLATADDLGRLARRAASLLSPGREGSEAEYIVAAKLLERQGGSLRLVNIDPGVARHIVEIPLRVSAPGFQATDLSLLEGGLLNALGTGTGSRTNTAADRAASAADGAIAVKAPVL